MPEECKGRVSLKATAVVTHPIRGCRSVGWVSKEWSGVAAQRMKPTVPPMLTYPGIGLRGRGADRDKRRLPFVLGISVGFSRFAPSKPTLRFLPDHGLRCFYTFSGTTNGSRYGGCESSLAQRAAPHSPSPTKCSSDGSISSQGPSATSSLSRSTWFILRCSRKRS